MHITFNPPLGEHVVAAVPPEAEDVELHFTATFGSRRDYDEFKGAGARLEVWTELQVGAKPVGQWGELAFPYEPRAVDDLGSTDIDIGNTFSLLPADGLGGTSPDEQLTLSLTFKSRLYDRTQAGYTYRLIYPHGVEWLGEFGRDGVLLFKREDPRLALSEGWRSHSGASYEWQSTPAQVGLDPEHEVAKLSTEFEWYIWAVGDSSVPRLHTLADPFSACAAATFIPRARHGQVAIPQPFVLSANESDDFNISLRPDGVVVYTKDRSGIRAGGLRLRPPRTSSDGGLSENQYEAFVGGATSGCATHAFIYDSADPSRGTLGTGTVIPTCAVEAPITLARVSRWTLSALIHHTSNFAIYSRAASTFRFLDSTEPSEDIVFAVGPIGSQFVVSPAHVLSGEDAAWHIAILTPHEKPRFEGGSLSVSSAARPPTPPPTPPPPVAPSQSTIPIETTRAEPRTSTALTVRPSVPRNQVLRYIMHILSALVVFLQSAIVGAILYPYASLARTPRNETNTTFNDDDDDDDDTAIPPREANRSEEPVTVEEEPDTSDATSVLTEPAAEKPALLVKMHAGVATVLLRSDNVTASLHGVNIERYGKPVTPRVTRGEGSTFLMEFDFPEGEGLLKISLV